MMFFVKTEVTDGKVDELAQKIVEHAIPSVQGNIVFVSPDGRIGYNLVEAPSADAARQMFSPYRDYITIQEVTPILSMGHFVEQWKTRHAA